MTNFFFVSAGAGIVSALFPAAELPLAKLRAGRSGEQNRIFLVTLCWIITTSGEVRVEYSRSIVAKIEGSL